MGSSVQLDFATMALKGKRYEEAENIYMQIAIQESSAEAWTGLGICKLYQIASGRTVDEAVFCFEKAKQISPALIHEIENTFIATTDLVIKTFAKLLESATAENNKTKKAATVGLIIAATSAVMGQNSNSAFNTVATLAGTGAGVGIAVDAFSQMGDYEEMVKAIISKSKEAHEGLSNNVDRSRQEYIEYAKNIENLVDQMMVLTGLKKEEKNKNIGEGGESFGKKIGSKIGIDITNALPNKNDSLGEKALKLAGFGIFMKKNKK